jgi:hypothetical protein
MYLADNEKQANPTHLDIVGKDGSFDDVRECSAVRGSHEFMRRNFRGQSQ